LETQLLRLNNTLLHDPAIDAWFAARPNQLGQLARSWFEVMRVCGDEVREVLHDGCPVACLGDVPFACVNAFTAHVNLGFFQGASLRDPARLLEGSGKAMRHIKLRPGADSSDAAITHLIHSAYAEIKTRIEQGD
jgi:hypothetical protein